jgi:ectoine hydroxylase-related dioxygenase (phytanoyl-CoA dioxygenase family)
MKTLVSAEQIDRYQSDGFVIIEGFLDHDELATWRTVFDRAVERREGDRFSDPTVCDIADDDDHDEAGAAFFDKVFDQRVNLWQTDPQMRSLILDSRIAGMAAALAGVEGLRVWQDQALIKRPYANPTAFHLDVPYWSFSSRQAITIWIALDDATEANGCLYFFPGSHLETDDTNVGIGPNLDAIFDVYGQFANRPARRAAMSAGSCSFHNGMTIHGAGANMTNTFRRAMTCAYMPDGMRFNGKANVLPADQLDRLSLGDLLDDPNQNPLVWSAS